MLISRKKVFDAFHVHQSGKYCSNGNILYIYHQFLCLVMLVQTKITPRAKKLTFQEVAKPQITAFKDRSKKDSCELAKVSNHLFTIRQDSMGSHSSIRRTFLPTSNLPKTMWMRKNVLWTDEQIEPSDLVTTKLCIHPIPTVQHRLGSIMFQG